MQMTPSSLVPDERGGEISLLCQQCGAPLGAISHRSMDSTSLRCRDCGTVIERRGGVWISLAPERESYFSRFIHDYEYIRAAEGRGSDDEDYYLALPYQDLSGKNIAQWAIRARSFDCIEQNIVRPLAALKGRPLNILDLGAGNGWMSYRLALHGHFPVAVDILTNAQDGLGAAVHFDRKIEQPFLRVQAELDHLPFAASSFDLAIFNASFHYSEDFERTFGEAFRCTRVGGAVVVADTPWYAKEESGRQMVEEKHAHFASRYGFPSNSIGSLEFLTSDRLQVLQKNFQTKWNVFKPFYCVQWSLRPLIAKMKGRRTPSRFFIYAAWVTE
jgi:SAM-dependent methyltransferase